MSMEAESQVDEKLPAASVNLQTTYIYIYICLCVYMYVCVYIYMIIYVCVYTYIYIYTHVYTYEYTCIPWQPIADATYSHTDHSNGTHIIVTCNIMIGQNAFTR